MSEKYKYHGIDITLDVYELIRKVVDLLSKKERISFEEAYMELAESRLYPLLQDMETVYWSESPMYLLEEYYQKAGDCR